MKACLIAVPPGCFVDSYVSCNLPKYCLCFAQFNPLQFISLGSSCLEHILILSDYKLKINFVQKVVSWPTVELECKVVLV